tara:strand:+ start:71 stop:289 length:219 start_codon:yes stop_codon:yes gene_type:complete
MKVGDLVRSVDDNEVGIVAGTKTKGREEGSQLFRVIFTNGKIEWCTRYWLRKFSIEEYEESEAWDKELEEVA